MENTQKTNPKKFVFGQMGPGILVRNLNFLAVLCFLAIMHIANAHVAESKVRSIYKLKSELKELRWQYMTLQSDVMYNSTYSQISKKVLPLELEMAIKVPRKIMMTER
ncbi:MAG: FtsL-like putative cell division protein [Saprospiraceae bacterium]